MHLARRSRAALATLLLLLRGGHAQKGKTSAPEPECPGSIKVDGIDDDVHIVPTGWIGQPGPAPKIGKNSELIPTMDSRAYFASKCTAGKYSNEDYLAINFLGKKIKFTTDISGAGCGCNAAFYLTNMHQNKHESECFDHYCDANNVCGESCAEIDIMEANENAWHTTLHTAEDHNGFGGGYGGGDGWNGPRDFSRSEYGPGARCIDTTQPFDVTCSFHADDVGELHEFEVVLEQDGKDCPLRISLLQYPGNADLTKALKAGMTPIFSYWKAPDMLWMDGVGEDGEGPCQEDPCDCAESVVMKDFSISDIEVDQPPQHQDSPWQGQVQSADAVWITVEEAAEQPDSNDGSEEKQDQASGSEQESSESGPEPAPEATPTPTLEPKCPGKLKIDGTSPVEIVPAGWQQSFGGVVELDQELNTLSPHLGGRAYFADYCVAGQYDNSQYLDLKLLGRKLKFKAYIAGAGCGCVAELRLMPMRFNTEPTVCSDYYCDASSLCGEVCVEVDVMQANMRAFHSTLHAEHDHSGLVAGYGGAQSKVGPRDWSKEEYGPDAECIDTHQPFAVEASFPVDENLDLVAMEVLLHQAGKKCNLSARLANYQQVRQISKALEKGVTPVVGYWNFSNTFWLDGPGLDKKGPCEEDSPLKCTEKVTMWNFAVEELGAESAGDLLDGSPAEGSSWSKESAHECVGGWKAHPECVGPFGYQGVEGLLPACTTLHVEHWAWCSKDDYYGNRWERCAPCTTNNSKAKMLKSQNCVDVPGWASSTGATCAEYFFSNWCASNGSYGAAWQGDWGSFSDWAGGGAAADEACCLCGGGGLKSHAGSSGKEESKSTKGTEGKHSSGAKKGKEEEEAAAEGCSDGWSPSPRCSPVFVYNDKKYTGCTTAGSEDQQGWCSLDARYSGRWAACAECGEEDFIADLVRNDMIETREPLACDGLAHRWAAPSATLASCVLAVGSGAVAGLLAVATRRRGHPSARYLLAEQGVDAAAAMPL